MADRFWLTAVLGALLALAGCGDLPQPFLHNPGATARRLAQPPPTRLSVPVPKESLLPDEGAANWAKAMTDALSEKEVPAVMSDEARKGDWQLVMSAEMRGNQVVPSYLVENPAGVAQGTTEGAPVPVARWAEASPTLLKSVADAAAPGVSSLLERIEAARRSADPNDLMNRPAKVYFSGVTGAPGDGNAQLARHVAADLADIGQAVQDSARGADFSLRGQVVAVPEKNGQIRVEIQWIVDAAPGDERGRVVQINEVPPGTLDHYWGDVAVIVATQAAGGIKEVLANQTGRHAPAKSDNPSVQNPTKTPAS